MARSRAGRQSDNGQRARDARAQPPSAAFISAVSTRLCTRFALPLASLPPEVQTGSLLTAVAIGSTSEFGNAVTIGLVAANSAPLIVMGDDVLLPQGDRLKQTGYFVDPDSAAWVAVWPAPQAFPRVPASRTSSISYHSNRPHDHG